MAIEEKGNWGAAKKFRLIIREQGQTREMGGNEMSLAVGIVDNIMMNALDTKSSDIHLQPERNQLKIRYRQVGVLHETGALPPEQASNVIARLKLSANMRIDETREPQDGRIDMEYNGRRLSARASCVPSLNGEKFVMRLLDPQSMKVNLGDLGMPDEIKTRWEQAIQIPYGLILVTGPTGSGKTSTLYASLNLLDSKRRNIVTVEDPVEYEFDENIAQVQVTEKLSFPRVMRSFLRQDPDIMMVGEMRDPESLAIGIQAGLTGHMVLSTIHTNNAMETIGRMFDMDAEPYLVGGVITAILAQRLVRTVCPKCAQPARYSREELEMVGIGPDDMPGASLMEGKGCDFCKQTGYKGRIGIFELIIGNREFKQAVAQNVDYKTMLEIVKKQGFRTMLEDGKAKVLAGKTSPDEVIKAVFTQALD
jgi:type II secretory ATPase GspE/PulE/Tfp pilus assembly ATPase PilB-like protein